MDVTMGRINDDDIKEYFVKKFYNSLNIQVKQMLIFCMTECNK